MMMCALLLVSTHAAKAKQPNLSFVEIGYKQVDSPEIDFGPGEFSGFNLAASFEIGKGFYIPLHYFSVSNSVDSIDATLSEVSIGIGYKLGVSSSSAITIDSSMLEAEVDLELNSSRNLSAKTDGVLTRLMYRHLTQSGIQFNIGLQHIESDINEDDLDGLRGRLGLLFHFKKDFAIKVEVITGFDETQTGLFARYSF